ncbi:rhombosortase [Aliikangiella sp. IMCC44632]
MPNISTQSLLKRLYPEYIPLLAICSLCTLVQLFAPASIELLRYETSSVSHGELWRIFSANFTHSNWNHLLLNLTGLILIDYIFSPTLSVKWRMGLLGFCMLINVSLLHWFMNLTWYVGLSGALHGYLVGCAILSWRQSPIVHGLVVVVVAAKLAFELIWEINQSTASLIEANVVEESHLFGAIAGVIFSLCVLALKLFNPKQPPPSKKNFND